MLASYDIVIVGGGPAGLSAAIYGRRAERSVLVLEKNGFGGQIAWSPKVDNFPGIPEISGAELADRMFAQALDMGAQAELAEVTGLRREGKGFAVITPEGEYAAKTVILATGAQHRRLGVPREEELAGNGVCYCAVCDGAFYKDRPVAVAGGGDAALQDALLLSNGSSKVYIIHRRDEFRAEAANVSAARSRPNIEFCMSSRVAELEGEGELTGLVIEPVTGGERRSIKVDGLFVAVGYEPANAPFAELAHLDEAGWFAAGEDCAAGVPGVFAAGDCRAKTVRQLTTAVGDGAAAAVAACRHMDRL